MSVVVKDWDANQKALARVTLEGHTQFTPTWKADSADPAIGNGTLTGFIQKSSQIAIVSFRLTMGSTTTYGTGNWYFTGIPTARYASPVLLCHAFGYDSSATDDLIGVGRFVTTSKLYIYLDSHIVDATHPVTWNTGDIVEVTAIYPLAEI